MRYFPVLFAGFFLFFGNGWQTDFENVKKQAEKENKLILLNFSGSDWCIPCIRLRKEVFESTIFKGFAESNLVLINADFPRLKKNKSSKDLQKKNDKLAETYNSQGSFPMTLLLDAKGKVIKSWEGFPNLTAEQFTGQLIGFVNARK